MFTKNIKNSVSLMKSGVKWDNAIPESGASSDNVSNPAQKALKILDDYLKNNNKDVIRTYSLLKDVQTANRVQADAQKANIAALQEKIQTVINNEGDGEYASQKAALQKLLDTVVNEDVDAKATFDATRSQIADTTSRNTAKIANNIGGSLTTGFSGAIRPPEKGNSPNLEVLQNISIPGLDSQLLKQAISTAGQPALGGPDQLYERVVGVKPDWKTSSLMKETFQKELSESLASLRSLTGANAGLYAILFKGYKPFTQHILKQVKDGKINPNKVVDLANDSGLSQASKNVLGGVLTALVAAGSLGRAVAGYETSTVIADDFIHKIEQESAQGTGFKDALSWIKEAYMGRKLSLTIGAEPLVGNADTYYKDILQYTRTILGDDSDKLSKIPGYTESVKRAESAGLNLNDASDKKLFQKALIQTYIVNEGYKRQGTDWVANISPFFVGAGRSEIGMRQIPLNRDSGFVLEERNEATQILSIDSLKEAGINFAEEEAAGVGSKEYTYTIPYSLQLPGDMQAYPVQYNRGTNQDNYNFTFTAPQDIHLDFDANLRQYTISFTPSNSITPTATVTTNQTYTQAPSLERADLAKATLDDIAYYIGHADPKVFGAILRASASQDMEAFRTAVEGLPRKYTTLKRRLLGAFNAQAGTDDAKILQAFNTYTYGANKSRTLQQANRKAFNAMRTKAVLHAENELGRTSGVTFNTKEQAFIEQKNTRPVELNTLISDQPMSVAVFATPAFQKNGKVSAGVHRIDTIDNSIMVAPKIVDLKDTGEKMQVVNMLEKSTSPKKGIGQQLDLLNTFLKDTAKIAGSVTIRQYKEYLATGDARNLGIPGLQAKSGKGPRICEARAMIAGNVCLNRTFAIGYPVFQYDPPSAGNSGGDSQKPTTVYMNYSAALPVDIPIVSYTALGASPVGIRINNVHSGGGAGGPDTTTTPGLGGPSGAPTVPASMLP